LTESDRLSWGYPVGREYRNYFVQRCFDYTSEVHNFLAGSQTIRCASCATSFPLEKKESFELFKWKCPTCGDGQCSIVNLADDYEAEVATAKQDLMLEEVELNILSTLYIEENEMAAGEISSLIDVSYQLVGHRTSKLRDFGLVEKERSDSDNRMRSALTEKALATYFHE